MAFPTTEEQLTSTLDTMKAKGRTQAQMKSVIDEFFRLKNSGQMDFVSKAGTSMEKVAETTGLELKNGKLVIKNEEDLMKLPTSIQEQVRSEKSSEGITGYAKDTLGTAFEGVKTMFSGAKEIEETLDATPKETAAETTTGVVTGVADITGGGMQAVFAPVTEAIERTPVVNTLFEKLGEGVDTASEFLADKIATNEDEKVALQKSFNNLFNLAMIRTAQSPRVQAATKASVAKGIEFTEPIVGKIVESAKNFSKEQGAKYTKWSEQQLAKQADPVVVEKYSKGVERNMKGLDLIESGNKVVQRAVEKAKNKGVDVKQIISETDLLKDSVDANGTLRTVGEGRAIEQLTQEMSPYEGVVAKLLELENKALTPEVIELKLTEVINNSSLKGANKISALEKISREVEGLKLEQNAAGEIPLSEIQKAKTDKYVNLDYSKPASKSADKSIARAYKELVEEYTTSADVAAVNAELGKYYTIRDFLRTLDGRKVKGGKLGKYFNQTVGAIVGSGLGPLGSIVGAEIGKWLAGKSLEGTFKGGTGKTFEIPEVVTKAAEVTETSGL